ncbi:OmpA family protein [bacterium]|nr:OmpA family protein [bacterium]
MKDLRLHALKSLALAAAFILVAGCQSGPARYFTNRYFDFQDMINIGVGATAANDYTGHWPPSLGAYVQVTDYAKLGAITHNGVTAEIDQRGVGAYPEMRTRAGFLWWEAIHLNQIYEKGYTNYFKEADTRWAARMNSRPKWMGAPPKDYVYDTWESDLQYDKLMLHQGWQHILNSNVEVAVCEPFVSKVGLMARVGFDVSEVGDFVLGWFGIDMYGDDLNRAEYNEFLGISEPAVVAAPPAPAPPAVAPAVQPIPPKPAEIVVRELPNHILFQSGKAVLTDKGKQVLRELADELRAQYSGQQIIVEGHTDSQPIRHSKWSSNWNLGATRATAVVDYLVKNCGIADVQIEQARTFSDHKPVDSNDTAAGRQKNRRTTILVKAR